MRNRLSYANVMATIAVFIALGGTGYAAVTITGRNVKDGSLTTADVKDKSLLSKDFKTGQLPAGKDGAPGPVGPRGPQGYPGSNGNPGADGTRVSFQTIEGVDRTVGAGTVDSYLLICPVNWVAISASFTATSDNVSLALADRDIGGTQYRLKVYNRGAFDTTWRPQGVCAKFG